ncbi:hypothetical protein CCR75_009559 [Bremia lactucae]|uniref:RxLR effector protein n=1 Tax=Bremia lactucae TaxID=4779 RepID=A0A976FN52_BRELC|nr:hypothetical protein CCR75_009559 [Bremia lactucae]
MRLPFHVLALVTTYALSMTSQTSAESSLVRATVAHEQSHMESLEAKRSLRAQQTSPLNANDERISFKNLMGKIKGIVQKFYRRKTTGLRRIKNMKSVRHD